MKKDSVLYVVLFTFIACALFVFILSAANQWTKPLADANREFTEMAAVLDAFDIRWGDKAEVAVLFNDNIQRIETSGPSAYLARIDGKEFLAVEQAGPGLWGTITVILAADKNAERVRGIQLVSQNETPGLGGRIDEEWFLAQFRGEKTAGGIRVISGAEAKGSGDSDPDNALVDGISGATRTSQAFEAIVNNAVERIRKMAGGEK